MLIVFSNFSGKSTLACSLSRELHSRGKLSYVLDGDNLRHGLNMDLGFKPEDRTENIRRTGKLTPVNKFFKKMDNRNLIVSLIMLIICLCATGWSDISSLD